MSHNTRTALHPPTPTSRPKTFMKSLFNLTRMRFHDEVQADELFHSYNANFVWFSKTDVHRSFYCFSLICILKSLCETHSLHSYQQIILARQSRYWPVPRLAARLILAALSSSNGTRINKIWEAFVDLLTVFVRESFGALFLFISYFTSQTTFLTPWPVMRLWRIHADQEVSALGPRMQVLVSAVQAMFLTVPGFVRSQKYLWPIQRWHLFVGCVFFLFWGSSFACTYGSSRSFTCLPPSLAEFWVWLYCK